MELKSNLKEEVFETEDFDENEDVTVQSNEVSRKLYISYGKSYFDNMEQ